jgi:protein ImuB
MFACIYGKTIVNDGLLSDFAYGFSPLVERTSANTVVIDVDGCELLFGSAYELAKDVACRATKSKEAGGVATQVNVALAGNPDTAVYAARFFEGITFISPGEELTCLGELPLQRLRQEPSQQDTGSKTRRTKTKETITVGSWVVESSEIDELLETLTVWGIHTFRDFAALPTAGVSERLGQLGVKLQQLVRGKTDRQLTLTQPPPCFNQSIELDHPITQLEPLSFLLARLLNQMCANLHAYALATNELTLILKLENGTTHDRKLSLPHAMRDPRVFLRLLLLDAEMHPPQSAVVAITINCEPVNPRIQQTGLFIPLAPEPEKLELTLARLTKLVGKDRVGSLELVDTHRPDAFRIKKFAIKDTRKKKSYPQSAIRNSQSVLGFRVFRPPLRALVQAARGFPTEINAWGTNRSVHGKVIRAAGPWRTTGDWWRLDRWARDEWDVAIESRSLASSVRGQAGQALYRIYRELGEGTWFVEGAYD